MQNFIDRLTNNMVVAAFVPALVFCSSLIFVFREWLSLTEINSTFDLFGKSWIFMIILSFVISLFLFYSRELIFQIYRGRYFPKEWSKLEAHRARKIRNKIELIKNRIKMLEKSSSISEISSLKDEWYSLSADYHTQFPSPARIVPTRLGNILTAAEECIANRYNLDPIPLWSLLTQLLPASSFQKTDDSINQLSLMINSSFLAAIFCLITSISSVYSWFKFGSFPMGHIVAFVISIVLFYFFYLASLPLAQNYARTYCSVFDLYRFDILKQMRLKCPKDSEEEAIIWEKVSELITIGTDFGDLYFKYKHLRKKLKRI